MIFGERGEDGKTSRCPVFFVQDCRIKDNRSRNFTVQQLFDFDLSVMTYKIMNKLCLENLQNKFLERSHYTKYDTTFSKNLHIPKYNREYTFFYKKNSFFPEPQFS